MLKTEKWKVTGMEAAFRGMRNPKDSWAKSDSNTNYVEQKLVGVDETGHQTQVSITNEEFEIGPDDMRLALTLCDGGPVHRKFMRQIFVSVDVTAPLYWWKEYDTYKIGTVANSCSTMHRLGYYPITIDSISHEHLSDEALEYTTEYINHIEEIRQKWIDSNKKDKDSWWDMVQMIPSSWNQKRTITFTYETIYGFLSDRADHKLDEWHTFCSDILQNCPYIKELVYDVIQNKKLKMQKANNYDNLVRMLQQYQMIYGQLTQEQVNMANKKLVQENEARQRYNGKMVIAVRPLAPDEEPEKEVTQPTDVIETDSTTNNEESVVVEEIPVKSKAKKKSTK